MPTANTSRAALQDLAGLFEAVSEGLSDADFSVTIAVVAGAAVQDGAAVYQPDSVQRMTMTPRGALRVSTQDAVAPMVTVGPWGSGSPW
jgi:hypothetical protein